MKTRLLSRIKQVLAMFLAIVTFLNVPLCAYADVHTSSDSSDDGELFYYDGEGNKIYDSDIDWSLYRDVFSESDYSDIMWTFDEYPETMMRNGDASTYIVGVDDAVVIAIFAIACAVCGYSISRPDIPGLISNGFEPWLRRNKGMDSEVMSMWQSALSTKLATEFTKMTLLVKTIKEFLGLATVDDSSISFPDSVTMRTTPYFSSTDIKSFAAFSTYIPSDGVVRYCDFTTVNFSDHPVSDQCVYLISDPTASAITVSSFRLYYRMEGATNGIMASEGRVRYNDFSDGYFKYSSPRTESSYSFDVPLSCYLNFRVPVFVNSKAAQSYFKYGTTGGLFNPDYAVTDVFDIANQWTDLQQDFFNKYAPSDSLRLPATQAEFDALVDSLTSSQTGAEVITTLKPVWDIIENSGGDIVVSPSASYLILNYVLSVLAGYCGATLTDEQMKTFISEFYDFYVHGTSVLVNEQAQSIVKDFVVINGGLQKPDDDNDKNKYKVLKTLAVSLGAFLVSSGLLSDSPDFDNEPSVSNNVQIVENQSGGTTNPDTGIDLSGILNYLKQFLSILNAWANPLTLMDSLVSKLGLISLFDSIKTVISNIPKMISGELSLPELFGNVTDAIFSIPQQVADAIANALGLEKALDGLGLNKLFDNLIELLPDVLVEGFAFPDLFFVLGTVIGSIPSDLARLFGISDAFSLTDLWNNLLQSIQDLPSAFSEKFPPSSGSGDSEKEDSNDSGFRKFINALILLALILVVLLIFFLNCLRFIVLLFQIPASAELFNENILSGMNFLKTTVLPIFNVSLYSLLMGAVYFVIFMSIIGAIRKKIDHIKIPHF